ncbi:hypothetical protein PUN4_540059 [Paraburkholderia unamae]|uniref:hypothetical protein n=1 Tax=Paraburkholderia unamae TaxID=219649 RepID=UPI001CB5D4CE|nr:hypothetical protein [Paraburkholderia unamae]CAG9267611.1 hypothetical protein PUN4_540059 [Paraburkholderia unamae]
MESAAHERDAASQESARALRKTIRKRTLADWFNEMTSGYLFESTGTSIEVNESG